MTIRVLFFAHAADAAGCAETTLDIEDVATVSSALDTLCERYPSLAPLRPVITPAVDERYVTPSTELRDGQTLALIPPVSGG